MCSKVQPFLIQALHIINKALVKNPVLNKCTYIKKSVCACVPVHACACVHVCVSQSVCVYSEHCSNDYMSHNEAAYENSEDTHIFLCYIQGISLEINFTNSGT